MFVSYRSPVIRRSRKSFIVDRMYLVTSMFSKLLCILLWIIQYTYHFQQNRLHIVIILSRIEIHILEAIILVASILRKLVNLSNKNCLD